MNKKRKWSTLILLLFFFTDRSVAKSIAQKKVPIGVRYHIRADLTAMTVVDADSTLHCEADVTDVHFEAMSEEAIRRYIATKEPMDKAGAYAVQGIAGLWIDKLQGSHTNVIGLPMALTRRLLEKCGLL